MRGCEGQPEEPESQPVEGQCDIQLDRQEILLVLPDFVSCQDRGRKSAKN